MFVAGSDRRWARQRRHLRGFGALGLVGACVGTFVLVVPQWASAESKAAPQLVPGAQHHDVPGFPGTSTTAPFNECPQVAYDQSCGVLVVVNDNGVQILQDPNNQTAGVVNPNPGSQMPFDNSEDTLVGVVNQSSKPVYALHLSGDSTGTTLFGFEGDGICTYATGGSDTLTGGYTNPSPQGKVGGPGQPAEGYSGDQYCNQSQLQGGAAPNGSDPNGSDYQGPANTFSNISPGKTSGNVNFGNGLAPGASTYFSTENTLVATQVGVRSGSGYWMAASDGGIFAYDAPFFGSMGGKHLNQPIVGIAADPKTVGYWEVASDGGIFAFNAPFFGSMGGKPLNQPIVGMVATRDGGGYWEVASDGGIFSFGDAAFDGSMGGKSLNAPVVGIAATADGAGYWEVATDGGIFAFGDASFFGSMGGKHINQPVVGITGDKATGGYWEVARDGGLFAFDAPFFGSTGGIRLNQPVVGMASTPDGQGYWEAASDGGIFNYGNALFWGSLGSTVLNKPVIGIAGNSS
jgi:hypothetical protein